MEILIHASPKWESQSINIVGDDEIHDKTDAVYVSVS